MLNWGLYQVIELYMLNYSVDAISVNIPLAESTNIRGVHIVYI